MIADTAELPATGALDEAITAYKLSRGKGEPVPGAELRLIRRRIRTVQSTMKITRAMELIASSRIVRAQQRVTGGQPYTARMRGGGGTRRRGHLPGVRGRQAGPVLLPLPGLHDGAVLPRDHRCSHLRERPGGRPG